MLEKWSKNMARSYWVTRKATSSVQWTSREFLSQWLSQNSAQKPTAKISRTLIRAPFVAGCPLWLSLSCASIASAEFNSLLLYVEKRNGSNKGRGQDLAGWQQFWSLCSNFSGKWLYTCTKAIIITLSSALCYGLYIQRPCGSWFLTSFVHPV